MVAAVIRAACTISPRYRVGQRLAAATMALVMVRDFQRLARYRLCDQTGITASSVAQETAAAGQQACRAGLIIRGDALAGIMGSSLPSRRSRRRSYRPVPWPPVVSLGVRTRNKKAKDT